MGALTFAKYLATRLSIHTTAGNIAGSSRPQATAVRINIQ